MQSNIEKKVYYLQNADAKPTTQAEAASKDLGTALEKAKKAMGEINGVLAGIRK